VLGAGALGLLEDRHLDDPGTRELPVHIDEVIESRHAQAYFSSHARDEVDSMLEHGVPVSPRFILVHHQVREYEHQRRMDLDSGPRADLRQALQDPLLVVGVLVQEGKELPFHSIDLVRGNHRLPYSTPLRRSPSRNSSSRPWSEAGLTATRTAVFRLGPPS